MGHKELRSLVRFTDPFIHSPEKEEDILRYFESGELRPPALIEHNGEYLVFNGNHRVLVACAHKLSIECILLENLDDILESQALEGDQFRDISMVCPLTFEGIVQNLMEAAELYGHEDPEKYTFRDMI